MRFRAQNLALISLLIAPRIGALPLCAEKFQAVAEVNPKARVETPVPGLYESVPTRLSFREGHLTVRTKAEASRTGFNYVTNMGFEVGGDTEVMTLKREISLPQKMITFKMAMSSAKFPSFVELPGAEPLVPGRGVPAQVLATLHQMRLANVKYGSLKTAIVDSMVNYQTGIELLHTPAIQDWMRAHPSEEVPNAIIADAILSTQTGRYIKTVMTQSGHKIVNVHVFETTDSLRWKKNPEANWKKSLSPAQQREAEDLDPALKMPFHFKIEFDLAPWDSPSPPEKASNS